MDITPIINRHSIEYVKSCINLKNSSTPFTTSETSIKNVIGDMNTHPYPRFFRGQTMSNTPVIFERETAWRELTPLYAPVVLPDQTPIDHLFQNTCSVILPQHKDIFSQYEKR